MNMNIKFSFWEVSFKGQVLTYKLTFKGAHRWMKKWMVEVWEHRITERN